MVTLHISYKTDANSQPESFISVYPKNIAPDIFSSGHEDDLSYEAPFIAQRIWDDINKYAQQRVITSSVTCVMEFQNGRRIILPSEIINAKLTEY